MKIARVALPTALAAAVVWLAWRAWPPPAPPPVYPVAAALGRGTDTTGFVRAEAPREFRFPADHGPHAPFRTEWWYFTGNLTGAGGRRFGYQLTFFRIALVPQAPPSVSAWRTRDLYMAHFAVTDVEAGVHRAFERFSRGAAGLAGARAAPFAVWLEDWSARGPAVEPFDARLRARAGDVAIDLQVTAVKPVVLNGERGLSRKSAEPGNASYYYSSTRLDTRGTVRAGDRRHAVAGTSWLDREWSTSALGPDQVGWDWFGLQLEDGRELMYYRLRRRDGGIDPASAGMLVGGGGDARPLAAADVEVRVLDHWRSPASGVEWPARWTLAVPAAALELEVTPVLADQELRLTVRYWEGAVDVRGRAAGRPVRGRGYVELTGYGETRGGARGAR